MRRAVIATAILAVLILHFTPSTTPYSPYNTGPDGLSKLAQLCGLAEGANVVIIAPGAALPDFNITADETPIVDPYVYAADPHIIIVNYNGTPVLAANATPLRGPGRPILWTSPASITNGSRGPFVLGLAVTAGNTSVRVFHASLFINSVIDKNKRLVEDICRSPVRIVTKGGDLVHYYRQLEATITPWVAPLALILFALFLYTRSKTNRWPSDRL